LLQALESKNYRAQAVRTPYYYVSKERSYWRWVFIVQPLLLKASTKIRIPEKHYCHVGVSLGTVGTRLGIS
jgi:hypothetical protein